MKRLLLNNKWRTSFWLLALINLGVVIWLAALVFLPSSYTIVNVDQEKESPDAEFTIVSTKENMEQLANEYLSELSTQTVFDYSITLDRNVTLSGNIKAFDQVIPINVELHPEVQENGDLVLRQEKISLGKLPLPNKKVLEFVKDNYNLPEWVIVNPNEENIYVAVTQMDTASNFNVKVDRFNLNSNQLAFKIAVPSNTFQFAQRVVNEHME
ncbi:YpmS family protein [Halobacillus sp. Nhm2S1]|uniref:YpmS family protein n=1 Tax=Halobacillus sp. Nhm2S1 TaxID=2866716 RepID=UPI001C72B7E5|nr:YpmS family protein [Halobacillus sp. Nhm2S1]MBX0358023.1 YpmS family protein [Halobacillus sp. Nhm2S1]